MPDPRYPGAEWIPGRVNAGYAAGRTPVTAVVAHYTVGRDSSGPGYLGRYFQFLVTRDGRVLQGAETDAVCWHAGTPWNQRGPGIEVEYHPGYDGDLIFTPEAEAATAGLVDWLHAEWGVPLDFYDGPRRTDWHGFITHRSLIQTGDAHSDWWPYLPTGDDMAEADLTLKALNDVRNVVGGNPNLDGSAPTIAQVVADVLRLEQKVDAITTGGVDEDALADKIAANLAARLKD